MAYKITILGPQGSGKGTQAELLAEKLKLPTLSVGQLLRDEVEKKGPQAEIIEEHMNRGDLVPNGITHDLLERKLKEPEIEQGYVLDGFPRIMIQAKFFERIASFTHVIVVWISDVEAIERISGRRVCPCGEIYHIKYKPPKQEGVCGQCQAELEIRDDDKPEAVRERLKIFHAETKPVIEYYKQQGIVYEIDGERSIEDVHADIVKIFLL